MKYEWMSGNEPLLGSTTRNVIKLLIINWFRVHPKYYYRLFMTFLISGLLYPFRVIQHLKYNHKIRKTTIRKDPIFIIGVWRTGTTYLHYLMTQDKQFGYQSNLLTYMPHAGLNASNVVKKLIAYGIPETRPMDNVKLSPDKPGEEDFAIALESQFSFYHNFMFPRRMNYFSKYLTFNECPKRKVKKWKKRYYRLIKKLTFVNKGKQLLLKNPPNTARIKLLKELFPKAKFIYLYREPYTLYSSTIHLYQKLLPNFSYQKWNEEKVKNKILENFITIQEEYEKSKIELNKYELIEIKYSDLLENPIEKISEIYSQLEIDDYKLSETNFNQYILQDKNYEANKHEITDEIRKAVNSNWNSYITNHNFEKLI